MIRKRTASRLPSVAPFQENQVVEYREAPHRRLIVAHCYRQCVDGVERWIVAEINADSHDAADLRLVAPAESRRAG